MFLRAKLKDGQVLVSEFSQLARVERYAIQVYNGTKPFNAWKVVSTDHPVSGERQLHRERMLVNGAEIVSLQQVEPTTEDHGYEPDHFQPVAVAQRGPRGVYRVPEEDAPEEVTAAGGTPGMEFPKHRDEMSFRDFIFLNAQEGTRFFLDGYGEAGPQHGYASGMMATSPEDEDEDDDRDPEWDADEDEDNF
jgi:hypothetical protein